MKFKEISWNTSIVEMVDIVNNSNDIGFNISKDYYDWYNISTTDQYEVVSSVFYLANLINLRIKE